MNGNTLAKLNGDWGENTAIKILENHFGKITFTNDLIDYVSDKGIGIEIKSCQEKISSGNPRFPIRPGRFVLTKPQHTFLIANDGYYVFMVHNNDLLIRCRIIRANLIRFASVVQWQRIFEIKPDSKALLDTSDKSMVDIQINPIDAESPGNIDFVSKTREI